MEYENSAKVANYRENRIPLSIKINPAKLPKMRNSVLNNIYDFLVYVVDLIFP